MQLRYGMRTLVALVLTSAVGLHCGAAEVLPSSSSPELAPEGATAAPAPGAAAETAPVAHEAKTLPNQRARSFDDFAALIADASTTQITSTTVDSASGATYAAGTFEDHVVIGGTLLKSKGDKDVFLFKVDAGGSIEWVRGVGSVYAENEPRVALDGAQVNVIGMTHGRMDCGAGPLGTWSSATFFFCVFGASDGTSLSGGVFPTGAP